MINDDVVDLLIIGLVLVLNLIGPVSEYVVGCMSIISIGFVLFITYASYHNHT